MKKRTGHCLESWPSFYDNEVMLLEFMMALCQVVLHQELIEINREGHIDNVEFMRSLPSNQSSLSPCGPTEKEYSDEGESPKTEAK